jgi:hypothetical protein
MTMFAAIIIPADVHEPILFVNLPGTLKAVQDAVGGNIEGLRSPAGTSALCYEDGKTLGRSGNPRATLFLSVNAGHNIADLIAGPVVIVGVDDEGETCDVPDAIAEMAHKI